MKSLCIVACILLSGCSSMKLGAMCYLPYGMEGESAGYSR